MRATIVLSGKSGSGKDAMANFIKEEMEKRGHNVMIIHFADAVKWFCRDFLKWDGKKDEVGRTLLQTVGTDIVRKCHPNFWVGIVIGWIQAWEPYSDFDIALVPDARFPNEVDLALQSLQNCVIVRVERKNEDGSAWINPELTEDQQKHPSETSLDNYAFDYIVHNDEDLDMLHESACTLLEDLKLI